MLSNFLASFYSNTEYGTSAYIPCGILPLCSETGDTGDSGPVVGTCM